jgi:hypothetical protein
MKLSNADIMVGMQYQRTLMKLGTFIERFHKKINQGLKLGEDFVWHT